MRVFLAKGFSTIHNVRNVLLVWRKSGELFPALERQHCRAARIIFGLPSNMLSVEVLAKGKKNTPHVLVEQLINRNSRSASRLKHRLIAPSFVSKYMQNSIAYRGAVLWKVLGRSDGSVFDCTDIKARFLEKRWKVLHF